MDKVRRAKNDCFQFVGLESNIACFECEDEKEKEGIGFLASFLGCIT